MNTLVATPQLFALDRAQAAPRASARQDVANSADPARKAAMDFEAVMLTQVLNEMFAGVTDHYTCMSDVRSDVYTLQDILKD